VSRKKVIVVTLFFVQAWGLVSGGSLGAAEFPEFLNQITITHLHGGGGIFGNEEGGAVENLKEPGLRIGGSDFFGLFRFEYMRHDFLWPGFAPWIAFMNRSHEAEKELATVGSGANTIVRLRMNQGFAVGAGYRFKLSNTLYAVPRGGFTVWFNRDIDFDLPQYSVSRNDGNCHEICISGGAFSIGFGALLGIRLFKFYALELGLEYQLYWENRKINATDGASAAVFDSSMVFSDMLAATIGSSFTF